MTDIIYRTTARAAEETEISMSALLVELRVPTAAVGEFTAAFKDLASRFGCDGCEVFVTYTSRGGIRA